MGNEPSTINHRRAILEREYESEEEDEVQRVAFNVENIMKTFNGGNIPIKTWINDFENKARNYEWSAAVKLVYCRQLLRGTAKKHIDTTVKPYSYNETKAALIEKFEFKVPSVSWNPQPSECNNENNNVEEDKTVSESEENENIPFIPTTKCTSIHDGEKMMQATFPTNIDNLFKLLFSKSKFMENFQTARKCSNMVYGEWNGNTRIVKCKVTVTNPLGPNSIDLKETQVKLDCSKPGERYSIDIRNDSSGAPYTDCFFVKRHYCLEKTVSDHTKISVYVTLEYTQSVIFFVKPMIASGAMDGLKEYYDALLISLRNEKLPPPPAKIKAKPKAKRCRQVEVSLPRQVERTTVDTANADITRNVLLCPVEQMTISTVNANTTRNVLPRSDEQMTVGTPIADIIRKALRCLIIILTQRTSKEMWIAFTTLICAYIIYIVIYYVRES